MEKQLTDSFWDFVRNPFGEYHLCFSIETGDRFHLVLLISTVKEHFNRFGDSKKIDRIILSEPIFMEIMERKLKEEDVQAKFQNKEVPHILVSPEDFELKDYRPKNISEKLSFFN